MALLRLAQGQECIIDDDVWEWASETNWYAHTFTKPYPARKEKRQTIFLHRLILPCPAGKQIDHINGDHLDNRRENLRIVSQSENLIKQRRLKLPASGFPCVYFTPGRRAKPWRAAARRNLKKLHLGTFYTPEEAFEAYRQYCIEHDHYDPLTKKLIPCTTSQTEVPSGKLPSI